MTIKEHINVKHKTGQKKMKVKFHEIEKSSQGISWCLFYILKKMHKGKLKKLEKLKRLT